MEGGGGRRRIEKKEMNENGVNGQHTNTAAVKLKQGRANKKPQNSI